MARNRSKNKSEFGSYAAKPHCIFRADTRAGKPSIASTLSSKAFVLLDNLIAQYQGNNNGDLSAAKKILTLYGWSQSNSAIDKAKYELLAKGFIQQTRQGGKNKASLYAVTWINIDECNDKLDVPPTSKSSNLWKPENAQHIDKRWVKAWNKIKPLPSIEG